MNQRELRFRAWDDGKKEWLLGYEVPSLGGFSLFGELILMGEWAGILNQFLFDRNGHKASDLKVMQFTGLKDKYTKEIYESDFIKSERGIGLVVFNHGSFMLRYSDISNLKRLNLGGAQQVEVIGNIYENSKLLQ